MISEMSDLAVLGAMILSVTFTLAGISKLRDPHGTLQAALAFGVPRSAAGVLAIALPLLELSLAVAFLTPIRRLAGLLAVVLLFVFTCVVVRAWRTGSNLKCACFGSRSKPVSRGTIARNGALILVASLVTITRSDPSSFSKWWDRATNESRLFAVVAITGLLWLGALSVFSWQLFKQQGRILNQIAVDEADDPLASIASFVPALELSNSAGTQHDLLNAYVATNLVFISASCKPCQELFEDRSWMNRCDRVVFVSGSTELGPDVLLDSDNRLGHLLGITGTPTALVVSPDGTVLDAFVGVDEIRAGARRNE